MALKEIATKFLERGLQPKAEPSPMERRFEGHKDNRPPGGWVTDDDKKVLEEKKKKAEEAAKRLDAGT